MGFRDYVRAASEQAKSAVAEYAETNSDGARRLQSALATAADLKDQALAKTDEGLAAFADTSAGQKTVRFVERAQQEIAQLPGVTAIADTSRSMHGVAALSQRVVDQPNDPWSHLWLAEALGKMKRTQRVTSGVRAVVEPSSLLTKTAVGGLNKLASGGASLEERLLRRSYVLACQALGSDVSGDTLHVLARVYRAVGKLDEARVALRPALLLEGESRRPCSRHVRSPPLRGPRVLFRPVKRPSGLWRSTARSATRSSLTSSALRPAVASRHGRRRCKRPAAELRGTVERSDLVAYYGTYCATGEAMAAAFAAQKTKTTEASSRLRSAAANLSGEMPHQRRSDQGRG